MLHPRHKLAYFKTARWEDDWIVTAEQLVREEYMQSYANDVVSEAEVTAGEVQPNGGEESKKVTSILFILFSSLFVHSQCNY